MKEKEQIGFLKGHFWNDDGGVGAGWSGCSGLLTCQRCLSQARYYQKSATDPRKIEKMFDLFGKEIIRKKWKVCTADVGEIKNE